MNNWGGKREGAGRKIGWRKENPCQRQHRQLRAFDDEWFAIKEFMKIVREVGAENALKLIGKQNFSALR